MNTVNRNDPCWCGSGKKYKKCRESIDETVAHYARQGCAVPPRWLLKSGTQIDGIQDIGGHGVGLDFHEDPWVGFARSADRGLLLVSGMVFTIEPMIKMGAPDIFKDSGNDWTIYPEDGKPSAQWEISIAVTERGHGILAH